jgi:hypothetical protein
LSGRQSPTKAAAITHIPASASSARFGRVRYGKALTSPVRSPMTVGGLIEDNPGGWPENVLRFERGVNTDQSGSFVSAGLEAQLSVSSTRARHCTRLEQRSQIPGGVAWVVVCREAAGKSGFFALGWRPALVLGHPVR